MQQEQHKQLFAFSFLTLTEELLLVPFPAVKASIIKAAAKFSEKTWSLKYMLAANQMFKCSSGKRGFSK